MTSALPRSRCSKFYFMTSKTFVCQKIRGAEKSSKRFQRVDLVNAFKQVAKWFPLTADWALRGVVEAAKICNEKLFSVWILAILLTGKPHRRLVLHDCHVNIVFCVFVYRKSPRQQRKKLTRPEMDTNRSRHTHPFCSFVSLTWQILNLCINTRLPGSLTCTFR